MSTSDGYTRIKLCGLCRPQDVVAANQARPDYVGFVVNVPKSRRNVSSGELLSLSSQVAMGIKRVGVFVDESVGVVADLFARGAIDVAQLHGSEDGEYVGRLRALCDVPIVQAFCVREPHDAAKARASTADLVLLDNGQGTGEAFDWSLVNMVERPFMLAGGLGPHNVADAVAAVHPWGVDMSSGIETNGLKDPSKMVAAVAAIRKHTSCRLERRCERQAGKGAL